MPQLGFDMNEKRRSESIKLSSDKKRQKENSNNDTKLNQKYGIGAKLLSQMGYVAGQGLGVNNTGIINPIQTGEPPHSTSSRVGLGMLSMARSVNDEYSSSSEEEIISREKIVSFKKSTSKQMSSENDNDRIEIIRYLNDLNMKAVFQYDENDSIFLSEVQKKLRTIDYNLFKEQKRNIKSQLEELDEITSKLSLLDNQIPIIENDLYDLNEYGKVLSFLKNSTPSQFKESIDMILKLPDQNVVDQLTATQVSKCFKNFDWSPDDSTNIILNSFDYLIEHLKYRFDVNKGHLNRIQTAIYEIIYSKLKPSWDSFDLKKGSAEIDSVITLLLNYETILKYIDCYDFIQDSFIIPKLINAIENWNLKDSSNINSPRLWLYDFIIVLNSDNIKILKDQIQKKLIDFYQCWDYQNAKSSDRKDLVFIKDFLDNHDNSENDYYIVSSKYFTKQFLENFWESFFDPLIELEEWNEVNENSEKADSIFAIQKLRSYEYLFHPSDYEIIMKFAFNEINKLLFQWLLYGEEEDKKKSTSWFNWFINNSFKDFLPSDFEGFEIKKSLRFLQNWESTEITNPIHDETFDLYKILKNEHVDIIEIKDPIQGSDFSVQNIPMRKVIPTFRAVVEDYCEEHNYLMMKLSDKYTQLDYGKDRNTLVPIFQVYQGTNKSVHVAIKDDILWIEGSDGKFSPTYLWKLKL